MTVTHLVSDTTTALPIHHARGRHSASRRYSGEYTPCFFLWAMTPTFPRDTTPRHRCPPKRVKPRRG